MSVPQYTSAVAKVNNAQGKKEDLQLIMAPYAGWQQMLTAAPLSIAILGQVQLVAGQRDFSLTEKPPAEGFKYIKYPESFRASLVHLSNEGYNAFLQAHTNMDQIRLSTAIVPDHLKYALQILVKGSHQEVELMLPKQLNKIQNIADTCRDLALDVDAKFQGVMNLICELLEACAVAQKEYADKDEKTKAAIQVAKLYQKEHEEQKKRAEEQYAKMEREIQRTDQAVREAIQDMPSGWEIVAMGVVETLTSGIGGVLSSVGSIGQNMGGSRTATNAAKKEQENDANMFSDEERKILLKMKRLSAIRLIIHKFIGTDGKLEWPMIRMQVIRVIAELEKMNNDISPGIRARVKSAVGYSNPHIYREKGMEICTEGLQLCKDLQKYEKQLTGQDDAQSRELLNRLETLIGNMNAMEITISDADNSNPINSPGPNLAQEQQSQSQSGGMVKGAIENSRFKVEQSRQQYHRAQDRYDEANKQLGESEKALTKTLAELAELKLEKISTEEIREILRKGIRALADVKEQWSKLVELFSMISNLIKVTVHSNITTFKETVEDSKQLMLGGVSMSDLQRDLIYAQAMEANKFAYVVHVISSSYMQVSTKHIMPPVASLSKLLPLDPARDQIEIARKQGELQDECTKAQRAIQRMNSTEKQNFNQLVEKRLQRLTNELEAVLPPISENRKRAIKESVDQGMKVVKEKEGDKIYHKSNIQDDFLEA